ncbi:MAG: diguanylate cyclase, partial [Leptolyngbyaceae bacterium]|nr:diguanylate cyclase [Leptolyngbyaceae bacterium]
VQVQDTKIVLADSTPPRYVTMSLGVASLIPDPASSYQSIVAIADQALYQAKANGRNRIEVGIA